MSSPYLSGLLGGGSLNHSFASAGHSYDEMSSSNAAGQNHTAAALSQLLGHPNSPYTFDSTAASFLSKFVSRPPSDAITTAIPVSPSFASASAAGSFPMPYHSSAMSAASMRLKSGSSCHQCKTNKDPPHLYFCSTKQDTATGKRNCRKKYCVACFPESDTRVLTNAGFLFLAEIEQRIKSGQNVQYACYDKKAQSLVYSDGELVYVDPPTRWVDFTQADTRPMWDVGSDEYGSTLSANHTDANRLTLRTTPGHEMFVQPCAQAGDDDVPAQHKMPAHELAPGYQCDCAAVGRACTHTYSHYRMYTGATNGLGASADVALLIDREEDAAKASKWLPNWALFGLDAPQLRLVIEGLRQASDALAATEMAGARASQRERVIRTMDVGCRDRLVHACLHAGYSAYFDFDEAADEWRVCYSDTTSELLPAQDIRYDGSALRRRHQQRPAAAIPTQTADLYDQKRDGRVWCVEVQHDDHLILVQRAHRNNAGVVTKAGRTIVTGNCMSRWYKQLGTTGVPGVIPPNGPGWSCPSCCGQCVCAACDRKKEKANRKAAEEGADDGGAGEESHKCEHEAHDCGTSETASVAEVSLGVKRERSDSCEPEEGRVSMSPPPKHAKMEISPPLNAVSASAITFTSEQKDRSPSTLVLPRPPPGYNRLQSEPNMPAFASPVQPMRTVTAQIATAIGAPLPPHARGQHNGGQSRPTPPPFQVPALPMSSSASSVSSSSSSTPLYYDPMQEATARAISRYYHNQQAQQHQQHQHQQQQAQQHQQHIQASKGYHPHATAATAYDHMRRGSEDVPSLTSFSSSNSSSVSTPVASTPPTHFTAQEDAALAFALDAAPTARIATATNAGNSMQMKSLPAQPLPLLASSSRAITVPVTIGETDRHTAVRAIQSIGLLNFDIGGPSPPTMSLVASPSLSPAVSVPSSPRSLNAWRSSLSLAVSSSSHLSTASSAATASASASSPFDALTSDPFHPSPLFNPLLPTSLTLTNTAITSSSLSTANTPRGHLGGHHTPVQFWLKSGVNSLCGTPRGGLGMGGMGGRVHGSRGGSMGEMEFQALFN